MNIAHNTVTDLPLLDWCRRYHEKCLRKYGPEDSLTRSYRDVIERMGSAGVEEKTLQVHYFLDPERRPLDTSC